MLGKPCDGLASHPGGSRRRPDGPPGSYADITLRYQKRVYMYRGGDLDVVSLTLY